MKHPPELRPHLSLPCQRCKRPRRIELSSLTADGRQKVHLMPRHGEYLEMRIAFDLVEELARKDGANPADARHVLVVPGSDEDQLVVCGTCRAEVAKLATEAHAKALHSRPPE